MSALARGLVMTCLATVACSGTLTTAGEKPSPVLAQDLKDLRVDGKVDAVLWTRRGDSYTLQVLLRRLPRDPSNASAKPRYAEVDPVVTRANGMALVPYRTWETPAAEKNCAGRCNTSELQYSYALAEGADAATASVRVDGELRTERLKALIDPSL